MLVQFFFELRAAGVPVSITEFLTLLEALSRRGRASRAEDFYYLARTCLVKDERHYDRFDRVFAQRLQGRAKTLFAQLLGTSAGRWLRALAHAHCSRTRRSADRGPRRLGQADGDAARAPRRAEGAAPGRQQMDRHRRHLAVRRLRLQPRGRAHRQAAARNRSAVKVWDQREFRNLDDNVELGTRNIKMALRRLRRFAREGAADELDLAGTIDATARNGGLLDLKLRRRAAQRGQGAAVPRRRRLDGRSRARLRGAVLRRAQRVQAPGALLLPQLPLRAAVAGQPPPASRRSTATDEVLRTYGPDYR